MPQTLKQLKRLKLLKILLNYKDIHENYLEDEYLFKELVLPIVSNND